MKCIHLGDKVGQTYTECCGGRKNYRDVYACNSPVRTTDICTLSGGSKGLAPVEISGGPVSVETLSVCSACSIRENSMQPCIHRGDKIGDLVQISGSPPKEVRSIIYRCESDQQPTDSCSPAIPSTAMSAMDIDGVRMVGRVASCQNCPYAEEPLNVSRERLPTIVESAGGSRVLKKWMEMREKRLGKQSLSRLYPLLYCSRLGCVREIRAENLDLREPKPVERLAVETRNLIYHVWPSLKSDAVWRKNIARIKASLTLFNGKRIVGVATDKDTASLSDVKDALGGEVDYFEVTNSPLGEMNTFPRLLSGVESQRDGEVTFYAHAKGIKYYKDLDATPHLWTEIMYETCLDYIPWVDAVLNDHSFAGTFKKVGRKFGASTAGWHYSGTFYWFRNKDIFSRDWNVADKQYWGSEAWPGKVSSPKDGGSLFMAADSGHMNVYATEMWQNQVLPYLDRWREIHWDLKT